MSDSKLAAASAAELSWSAHPTRALLKLAGPITVSTLSFSAMTLASTAFVAHVGDDELAGVGLGGVFAFALVCFGIGMLRGAKTLVSQALGAGRHHRDEQSCHRRFPRAVRRELRRERRAPAPRQ